MNNFKDYYDFIACVPDSCDLSKLPAPDADNNLNIIDALVALGLAKKNSNGEVEYPKFKDVCGNDKATSDGFDQFAKKAEAAAKDASNQIVDAAICGFTNKIFHIDDGKDYTFVFTYDGMEYFCPPTVYDEIVPEDRHIHEEGVNGQTTENGWEWWY